MSKKVKLGQKMPEGYDSNRSVEQKIEFLRSMLPPEPKKRLIQVNGNRVLEVNGEIQGGESEE